ncbi:MAG: hypothetical protein ACJ0BG_05065 [Dehalococcoidia bacterium]|tara:strand:+ start:270 stop:683 length:414 start_codon:yes stop_codon:yes gene_type:complete
MDTIIAGAASGLLFASMSIAFGCFAIFVMYRNGVNAIQDIFNTSAPSKIILSSIMVWNPTCVVLGIMFSLLFQYLSDISPGAGILSPNMFYTFFVIAISILLVLICHRFLNIVLRPMLGIVTVFLLIFGWLIPYLAL